MMSKCFGHGPCANDFDFVLKQLDRVFLEKIANVYAENHFSWDLISIPVSSKPAISDTEKVHTDVHTDDELSIFLFLDFALFMK